MNVLERLRGGLIVSCQAYPGEPLRDPDTMARVAESVALGGAAGIRAEGLDDLLAIRQRVNLPLIGLRKRGSGGVFITPTVDDAVAVAEAGAHIVAVDGTPRTRPDKRSLAETITALRERTAALVMADVSTYDEGVFAESAGADMVGTTLSGYTPYSPHTDGPDLYLVQRLAATLRVPVLAEGRIAEHEQAVEALAKGAFAVVVGTAITHPTSITRRYVQALHDAAAPSGKDRHAHH